MVDFSPCEKCVLVQCTELSHAGPPVHRSPLHSLLFSYIVSFSRSDLDNPESVIVWDTRTGVKKRGFSAADATDWPVLK